MPERPKLREGMKAPVLDYFMGKLLQTLLRVQALYKCLSKIARDVIVMTQKTAFVMLLVNGSGR